MLNALSRNNLSEAALLGKSLNLNRPYHVEIKSYLVHFDKYM